MLPIPPPLSEGFTTTTPVPLYWCRYEHVEAYRQILSLSDKTPAQLLAAVQAAGMNSPTKTQPLRWFCGDALCPLEITAGR